MIKKFTNEGYSGTASILRGGFNMFASLYPELIDQSSTAASPSLSLGGSGANGLGSNVPPVIGGVMLPQAANKADPFFSNIRQNQDLVDGVGQMDVGVPSGLEKDRLPQWLREATEANDHGKIVSDKFLQIELTEQSRMKDAYSAFNASDRLPTPGAEKVQLSGIEQGGKNRYKDILPFEHARVKLLGRPEGACDYVNASHIRAKRSYKRYIASQGPLPATFDDFWSVIWDNDVRVIVMLTAESEGGQLKCHPYWKGRSFGSIRLRALSEKKISLDIDKHRSASGQGSTGSVKPAEAMRRRANTTTTPPQNVSGSAQAGTPPTNGASETPYVTIRKFALSHAAHPFAPIREITHLHYTSWPDFGAPAQPSHLLALVELANVMQRATLPAESSAAAQSAINGGQAACTSTYFDPDAGQPPALQRSDSLYGRSSYEAPESNEHARPMLVHCSAGCGRTGTFCTVDSVIDMLKRQRLHKKSVAANTTTAATGPTRRSNSNKRSESEGEELEDDRFSKRPALSPKKLKRDGDGDIAMDESALRRLSQDSARSGMVPSVPVTADLELDTAWLDDDKVDLISRTVEEFRGQRLSMVQSLRQFVLCYETVLEWIARVDEYGSPGAMKGRGRSGSLAF